MPPDEENDSETDAPTTVDVLKYGRGETAKYVTVPSDTGTLVVAAHRRDASRSRLIRVLITAALALVVAIAVTLAFDNVALGFAGAGVVVGLGAVQEYLRVPPVPDLVDEAVHADTADEAYSVEFHVDEPIKGGSDTPDTPETPGRG